MNGSRHAIFRVPFEISFGHCNQFMFTVEYLDTFLNKSTAFFGVDPANLTIAFVEEIVNPDITIIDVGFTVAVNGIPEKEDIQSKSMVDYRASLEEEESSLPLITRLVPKYEECPSADKYSTFYHFEVECLWLCEHDAMYHDETNICMSTANMTSTEWVPESHIVYVQFVGIGYVASGSLSALIAVLFMLKNKIRNEAEPKEQETLQSDTETSSVTAKRRESIYKYQPDTEDEDQSKQYEFSVNSPMPQSKANHDDIQLSIDGKVSKGLLAEKANNAVEEEEVFVLEEIECEDRFQRRKSQIIDQSRRKSTELVDEFNKAIAHGMVEPQERNQLEQRLSEIKQGAVKELRKLSDDSINQ